MTHDIEKSDVGVGTAHPSQGVQCAAINGVFGIGGRPDTVERLGIDALAEQGGAVFQAGLQALHQAFDRIEIKEGPDAAGYQNDGQEMAKK
ncbi:hypothetical protein DESC_580023 [Desulfosarcina cetonica]|nr:hypothetical protein DESC_580023 [Desulfosarcina cetonica]